MLPRPVVVAPASASRPAPQQLGVAGEAAESLLSDGTGAVLLTAIVISMLCFVPRRLGR
jgi:hypothetical protein